MDISEIETFLMIVDTKSISKTAEILFLSQPTVSHRLKSLENDLGVQLIVRDKGYKGVTLTNKGQEFIQIAQKWLSLWKDTQSLRHSQDSYFLTIGCTDSFSVATLSPLYRDFLKITPSIDLKIRTHQSNEIYDLLSSYKIDIRFVHHHMHYKNIISEELASEKMYLIQPEGTELKKKRIHTDELNSENELFFSWEANYQIWHDRWINVNSRSHIQVDTISLLSELWCDNDNWLIAPYSVVKMLSRTKKIYVSEIINTPPNRITYKLTHKIPNQVTLKTVRILEDKLHSLINSEQTILPDS